MEDAATGEGLPTASSVRSRVAFFEKIKQGDSGASASLCGSKRAREIEEMTSPGHVREVQEKILTPTKAAVAEKPSDTNTNMSPGKVKQVVETMSSLTSRGNEENTPPSKRRRPNAAELVLSDLHAATRRSHSLSETTLQKSINDSPQPRPAKQEDALLEREAMASAEFGNDATALQETGMERQKSEDTPESNPKPEVDDYRLYTGSEGRAEATHGDGQSPVLGKDLAQRGGDEAASDDDVQVEPNSDFANAKPSISDDHLLVTGMTAFDAAAFDAGQTPSGASDAHVVQTGCSPYDSCSNPDASCRGSPAASSAGSVCSGASTAGDSSERARRALILTRSLDNSTRSGKRRRDTEAPVDPLL